MISLHLGLSANKGLNPSECRVLTTGLPGSSLFGVFKKLFSRQCSPEKLHHFTVPATTYECFSSTSSPDSGVVTDFFFFSSHSDSCVVMSHCGFNIYFSNVLWCFIFFCACLPSLYPLGELSLHVCPLSNGNFFNFKDLLLRSRYEGSLYILDTSSLLNMWFSNIFLFLT